MGETLNSVIEQVCKDKGIERSILVEALEASILTAAKKVFGYERQLEARYDDTLGQVELFQYMEVVTDIEDDNAQITTAIARRVVPDAELGDELGFQIFYLEEHMDRAREEDQKYGDILGVRQHRNTFGRVAAQTAKQVIVQRVREAERDMVYNEYKDRKAELVTGIARRFERGDVIVDLGRAEASLPIREQMPRESYRAGDRVQAYVKDVTKLSKGPQIILSRTDAGLIFKLFEMEVPEIYEGIVRIVTVSREPGERTKIAVASSDADVDPVGACVGMKGSRVQAVVQELRGEKIDIVPWSADIAKFVCHAIAPAEVSRVLIDEDTNTIELIVSDEQLSLAIGRRGQNVRLASQLVGWKIDIHSETKIEALKDELREQLLGLGNDSLDTSTIEYLFKLGFHSPENLLGALDDELTMIPGITAEVAEQIRNVARTVQAGVAEKKVTTAAPVRQATVTIEEKEERADPELRRFNLVKELSPQAIQALIEAGYSTVDKVAEEKNLAHLSAIPGFSLKRSRATKTACAMYLKMETEAGGFWKLVGEEPPAPPAPPVVLVPDPVDDLTEDETSEPDVESAASDDVDSANDTEASSSEAEPDTLDVVEDDTGSQDADEEPLLAAVDEAVESNGDDEATPNAAGAEVS
jgi:N utilization substance protein A